MMLSKRKSLLILVSAVAVLVCVIVLGDTTNQHATPEQRIAALETRVEILETYVRAQVPLLRRRLNHLAARQGIHDEPSKIIEIHAYIDHESLLIIRNGTIQWHNEVGYVPGEWSGAHFPTYVNGIAWHPRWPGGGLKGNLHSDSCQDDRIVVPPGPIKVEILDWGGRPRGYVSAQAELGGVSLNFVDRANGAAWYRVRAHIQEIP